MAHQKLYIFVEGDDDQRFFQAVVCPRLSARYDAIQFIKYAQLQPKTVISYVKAIPMGADYVFVSDLGPAPCATKRKESAVVRYPPLENSKIIVVRREIEGWYLAGIDRITARKLRIQGLPNTEELTKSHFQELVPRGLGSAINFMVELLKRYSHDTAKERNRSYLYFANRYKL